MVRYPSWNQIGRDTEDRIRRAAEPPGYGDLSAVWVDWSIGLPGESLIYNLGPVRLWETVKRIELVCCSCAVGARRGSLHDSLRRPRDGGPSHD